MDEAADVLPALLQVEHYVADALPGPVVGVAAATARFEHREIPRIGKLGRIRAGPGGKQRRMLEQPDALTRGSLADRGGALLHEGEGILVGHRRLADAPFDVGGDVHHAARWSGRGIRASGVARALAAPHKASQLIRGRTWRNCRSRRPGTRPRRFWRGTGN